MFDIRRQQKERVYRHIQFIANLIEPQLYRPTLRSHAISADIQVKLALRYLASGSPMRVIGDTMGYQISSVSRAVRNVSNTLCDIA